MKGPRIAAVAYQMIEDMIAGLAAAGTPPEAMPGLDEALAVVWPCAKALAKTERTAADAGESAGRAREAAIALAVARWAPAAPHPARPALAPGTTEALATGIAGTEPFDAERWRLALVRPAGDRDREPDREVA